MTPSLPDPVALAVYALPMALILAFYLLRHRRRHLDSLGAKQAAIASGLTEPASLHPVIDPLRCTGCGACVAACPEQPDHHVLGLIHGKAELIGPTDCIGHGACFTACPHDAITLVFGTETRGVDIPHVKPTFETNVPGIYIAGELGGMGLIRNAVEQGRQAVTNISTSVGRGDEPALDLVIVGAGPAGFAASLAAKEQGLRFVTLEQDTLGGTVAHYPRGKMVMTRPARLPIVGDMPFLETSKERLLDFWRQAERESGVHINYDERLESVEPADNGFRITSNRDTYAARSILLTIGRRGTPRRLEVPGEDMNKVCYRLVDPEQYRNRRVLVVGGGDSALEAALALAGIPGAEVTLSYRSAAFTRAKPKNREQVLAAQSDGRIDVQMESTVVHISEGAVVLKRNGKKHEIPNDDVIVCVGGILPTAFLRSLGIEVETRFGAAA